MKTFAMTTKGLKDIETLSDDELVELITRLDHEVADSTDIKSRSSAILYRAIGVMEARTADHVRAGQAAYDSVFGITEEKVR